MTDFESDKKRDDDQRRLFNDENLRKKTTEFNKDLELGALFFSIIITAFVIACLLIWAA